MRSRTRITLAAAAVVVLVLGGATSAALAVAGQSQPPSPNATADDPRTTPPTLQTIAANKQSMDYYPITPCRILDTRTGGGPLTDGTERDVYVGGTFGFSPQGGVSGGCGVPLGATAISAGLTATRGSASGRIIAWPSAGARPNATSLSYTTSNTTSTPTLSLTSGVGASLSVVSTGAKTDLVIDVFGYYLPKVHAVLAPTGGVYNGSPRVVSSSLLATGSYRVQLDIDPTGCTPVASVNGGAYIATAYVGDGYVYANTYTTSGNAINLYWTLTLQC